VDFRFIYMKLVVVWLKLLIIFSHLLPRLYLHCAVQSQFVTACFLPDLPHIMAVCFSDHFNLKNYARDGFLSSGLWQHASWNICVTIVMLERLCEVVTRQSAAVGVLLYGMFIFLLRECVYCVLCNRWLHIADAGMSTESCISNRETLCWATLCWW
jgi:hypothetical protein